MLKPLLTLVFSAAVMTVSADDYSYLAFETTGGSSVSYEVSGLEITFSDGNAVISSNGNTSTISLSDLSKMYFSATNGIKTVSAEETGDGSVYNLSGQKMDADNLPAGVYIKNGKKFVVK